MKRGNSIYLIVLVLVGSIIGSIIGKAFSDFLPLLNYGDTIGFGPATLNLNIINITLGFSANLTVAGIIGIIIAIIAYRKL